MSPALLKKYWATWKTVKDTLMTQQQMSSIMADAMRDELCVKVHGRAISSKDMTNDQAGDMLKEFDLILKPDEIAPQMEDRSDAARKRRQYIWSIKKEEKHPGYAQALSQDLYRRRDWENLNLTALLQLRRRIGNDYREYVIPGGNSRGTNRREQREHREGEAAAVEAEAEKVASSAGRTRGTAVGIDDRGRMVEGDVGF